MMSVQSILGAAAGAYLLLTPRLYGQQPEAQPPAPDRPAAKAPENSEVEPRAFIAKEIVRLALMDLRAIARPSPDDYQAALVLLGLAHDLDPKNTEIIRRQIEAAFNSGNQDAVIEHTRALLLEDPSDTVAQLRFISASISRQHQTAEARLGAYERYITSTKLDPSIRSRLALDAALLLRERGDEAGFNQKLIQSLQLDSTHKEAAALAVTVFTSRFPNDDVGKLDLLVNLLKADPVDPNIHLSIARILAGAGAYKTASRFHTNALTISSQLGTTTDQSIAENRVLKWYTDGPAAVVQAMAEALAGERDAAARELKRLVDAHKPTESAKKPEDIRPSSQLQALSILAADAAGDRASVTGQMKDFTERTKDLLTQLANPKQRGAGVSDSEAVQTSRQAMVQLNTLRLWVNVDAEKYNQDKESVEGIRKDFPQAATIMDALWAVRSGKPQEAIDACRDLQNERAARVATGMAYEALEKPDKAIEVYRGLVHDEPLELAAAWAHSRILALGAADDRKRAETLERLVADPRVPAWIDDVVLQPREFVRVQATVPNAVTDVITPNPVTITITNLSNIPLALGSDRAFNSRFALMAKLDQGAAEWLTRPEVIDLDRRLRLMPQESLSATVEPDPGPIGWVLASQANRSVRITWQLVQGFIVDPAVGYRAGPMCTAAETEAILLRPVPDSMLSSTELGDRINTAPVGALQRYLVLARAMVLQPLVAPEILRRSIPKEKSQAGAVLAPAAPAAPAALKPVCDALVARYAGLVPSVREMIAVVVPHGRVAPDLVPLDDAIRVDQDPGVRCIALCTRVADPADDLIKDSKASDDPRVRQVAAAVEARLANPGKIYSRLTPDDFKPPGKPGAGN
jgi:hypothetical protein